MGVDINTYRQQIGLNTGGRYVCGRVFNCVYKCDFLNLFINLLYQRPASDSSRVSEYSINFIWAIPFLLIYGYIMMYLLTFLLDISMSVSVPSRLDSTNKSFLDTVPYVLGKSMFRDYPNNILFLFLIELLIRLDGFMSLLNNNNSNNIKNIINQLHKQLKLHVAAVLCKGCVFWMVTINIIFNYYIQSWYFKSRA